MQSKSLNVDSSAVNFSEHPGPELSSTGLQQILTTIFGKVDGDTLIPRASYDTRYIISEHSVRCNGYNTQLSTHTCHLCTVNYGIQVLFGSLVFSFSLPSFFLSILSALMSRFAIVRGEGKVWNHTISYKTLLSALKIDPAKVWESNVCIMLEISLMIYNNPLLPLSFIVILPDGTTSFPRQSNSTICCAAGGLPARDVYLENPQFCGICRYFVVMIFDFRLFNLHLLLAWGSQAPMAIMTPVRDASKLVCAVGVGCV